MIVDQLVFTKSICGIDIIVFVSLILALSFVLCVLLLLSGSNLALLAG